MFILTHLSLERRTTMSIGKHQKRLSSLSTLLIFALAAFLAGCAGTQIERNSVPGLDINGKKLWVLVDDQKAYTGYTTKLDSIWKSYGEKNKLEIEYRKNEALALEPVSPKALMEECRDSYLLQTAVTGKSETTQYDAATGMVVGGSSEVEYTSVMYDCNTGKVVWKAILKTTGMELWAQSELVKGIFKDFHENSILKEEK